MSFISKLSVVQKELIRDIAKNRIESFNEIYCNDEAVEFCITLGFDVSDIDVANIIAIFIRSFRVIERTPSTLFGLSLELLDLVYLDLLRKYNAEEIDMDLTTRNEMHKLIQLIDKFYTYQFYNVNSN